MKLFSCLFVIVLFNICSIYGNDTIKIDSMEVITLIPGKATIIKDYFTLTVLEIVEAWLPPDRHSVIEANFVIETSKKTERLVITSDEPHKIWENYEFDYLGGWRDEVKLTIKKRKTGH
jgi:hypothetical protein